MSFNQKDILSKEHDFESKSRDLEILCVICAQPIK